MYARDVVRQNFTDDTDDLCNCGSSGGKTILCNVCFGCLFPRWAKVTKAKLCSPSRSFPLVGVWNAAGRQKKLLKHAKIKHAEARGKKKHAGRTASLHANDEAPPSTISATAATQNDGRCEFVPRLPRETKVDVRLCHACHAKCRGVTGAKSRPKRAT